MADPGPYQRYLRAWRLERKLSLQAVAEAISTPDRAIAYTTVQKWETGQHPLNSRSLVDLCRVYGVTPEELLRSPAESAKVRRNAELREITEGLDDAEFAGLVSAFRKLRHG